MVIIASPAFARSLTVGGNSTTRQTVMVQSSLTLGVGGGLILPTGAVTVNSALPFYSQGPFYITGEMYVMNSRN